MNILKVIFSCLLVLSLQELCCRAIVARTTVYSIEQLPLPTCVKSHLKSYALTSTSSQLRYTNIHKKSHSGRKLPFISQPTTPGGIVDTRTSCVPRNSCTVSWYDFMVVLIKFWCCPKVMFVLSGYNLCK